MVVGVVVGRRKNGAMTEEDSAGRTVELVLVLAWRRRGRRAAILYYCAIVERDEDMEQFR